MDFHKEWREKLLEVCERYLNGEFELPEFQRRLSSTSALLPKDVSADLERLLEEFELIRCTNSEATHLYHVKPLLKIFMENNE